MKLAVEELWEFFQEHRSGLKSEAIMIADWPKSSVEIYLTEHKGFPYLFVEVDGTIEYEEGSNSRNIAESVYTEIINLYGDEDSNPSEDEDEELSDQELMDELHAVFSDDREEQGSDDEVFADEIFSDEQLDRLDEIQAATEDFLKVLLGREYDLLEEQDMETILYYLEGEIFRQYEISTNHPTIVDLGDDDAVVTEYPFG